MKKIFLILFLGMVGSCKDKCPEPEPTGGSNGNETKEYTVKVKIVNGTTGNALYTDSKLYLKMERKYGLGYIENEVVGSAYMQDDGTIEITYTHSEMGDRHGANAVLYGGPWAVGFALPANQNVEKTIYQSTMGRVVLNLIDNPPGNKIFFAYKVANDSLISDSSDIYESRFIDIRSTMPGFSVYYDFFPLDIRKDYRWGDVVYGNPKDASVDMRGDPYIDTLTIEY
jgi:hypothetical protein